MTVYKCSINFADDWILWYRKRPLYQLSHNHLLLYCIVTYHWLADNFDFHESLSSKVPTYLGREAGHF